MKVITFLQDGHLIKLGIEGKRLFLRWDEMTKPMCMGTLEELGGLATQEDIVVGGSAIPTPNIIKMMGGSITKDGLKLASAMSDEEFFNEFKKDYQEMDLEGLLKLVSITDKWE